MANFGFPKASRLLNASAFEAVFSRNQFKVSNRNFLILALNTDGPSRLGIVIAKKNIASAVKRNRIKRLIRESFRTSTSRPANKDMVVLVRKGADKLSNPEIRHNLEQLWQDLKAKSASTNEASRKRTGTTHG